MATSIRRLVDVATSAAAANVTTEPCLEVVASLLQSAPGALVCPTQESLDSILHSRGWPQPCALKIDVEGSEFEVVQGSRIETCTDMVPRSSHVCAETGAAGTLSRWPHIFLELHPYELRDRGSSSSKAANHFRGFEKVVYQSIMRSSVPA